MNDYGDYYEKYLKDRYPIFDCITPNCPKYVLLINAMCKKCFYDKYPEMKVDDGKL